MFMSRISSFLPPRNGAAWGSLLLQFAESEAHCLRLPEVRLLMSCEMQSNQRFYERRGYAIVRTERIQGLDIAVLTIQPGGAARA
ncbi:hypothetical protein MB84_31550 (plasmid) [Pandoraea oxalativorans]|uniref:N-acetyltransferase domain-containing protein n=1 Tax=Pandoraea oxalativorans TaxID=573737 RepID=A0A192B142_9BURK|nr:hypothetical protein MB84_31550 [Pandoraea oxalativorans]